MYFLKKIVKMLRMKQTVVILYLLCGVTMQSGPGHDRRYPQPNHLLPREQFLRVSNLPNFVGFSYSIASSSPPSSRFIHFLREDVNVNSNFLPTYGSFRATRPGVYFFTFSFQSRPEEETMVALNVKGQNVIKVTSDRGGFNPVSQSYMTFLKPKDVVQLEILKGRVYESGSLDVPCTIFTGWLISNNCCHDDSNNVIEVERSTSRPPYITNPPATYLPPYYPPHTTTTPFIYTTTRRTDFGRGPDCCDSLLVSAGNRRVLTLNPEKFGVYRLVQINSQDGRAIFKHCENDVYIFYHQERANGWTGWIIGPKVGRGNGDIILRTRAMCVEKDIRNDWQYFESYDYKTDRSISVTCFTNDGTFRDDKNSHGYNPKDAKYNHFHHHEHYHNDQNSVSRRSMGKKTGPSYNIKSNPGYVEATFVLPNTRNFTYKPSHPFPGHDNDHSGVGGGGLFQDAVIDVERANKNCGGDSIDC